MSGLVLHLPSACDAVVVGVGLAGLVELLGEYVDGRAVLGVHHGQQPGLGRLLHGAQDLGVVGVEDAGVRHEQLEAGDALVDQGVHRLERELVDAADDLVEAVVDGAVALGLGVPGGQPVLDPLAVALHGEVDDRRGAAPGRGAGTRLEGVGGGGAAERQLHVGVGVDAAGDDVLAGRVDDLVDVALEVDAQQAGSRREDGGNGLAVDQDIRHGGPGGVDHRPALDQSCAHASPPPPGAAPLQKTVGKRQ